MELAVPYHVCKERGFKFKKRLLVIEHILDLRNEVGKQCFNGMFENIEQVYLGHKEIYPIRVDYNTAKFEDRFMLYVIDISPEDALELLADYQFSLFREYLNGKPILHAFWENG